MLVGCERVLNRDCVSSFARKATDNCWNRNVVSLEFPAMSAARLPKYIVADYTILTYCRLLPIIADL